MAEKIINNPSLLPGDLEIELSGGSIIAISGHPLIGSGGGTQSDYVYYPVFDDTTGNVEFHLGTTASNPQPAGGWHISGATGPQGIQGEQGIQGIQGIPGVDGKNPVFEIDSNNAHWKWKYAEATSGWTDTQVVASGAVGPKGQDGTNGVTPGVRINTSTNKWEIAADGTTWVPTDVNATGPAGQNGTNGTNGTDGKDGKDGTDGKDGVSPTVSTSAIPGGNRVTFTYGKGSSTYIDVMSGTSGASGASGASGYSPTITLEPATSVSYPNGGTKVIITDLEHQAGQEFYVWNGNDGQGATVNLLEGTGIKIEKVGQDYTIGVSGDYASTSDVEAASANALTQAESWVETEGYIKSVPDISGNNGLSANGHIVGINNTGIDANKQYAWTTTGWQLVSVPTIPDITAHNGLSANGHTVGIDDTNIVANTQYAWTTSGWKQVSIPDSYATKEYANDASANALREAKTWVESKNYLIQSDLDSYATKTYAETASANAYDKAVAKIPTDYITKDVNNLTYYYKKTETSGSTELSTEFANKVNKPDTSLTDKYLVLRTDTNGAVSGWCNFNDKIYSKTESDGRYMQKNTDSTLSGDGTTNSPLGIDSDNFYELDTAGNYLASQTSNQKTIISTTPALDNAISRVSTSADVWDTVSAKSTVTVNTANNEIKVNNNANSAISAVSYDLCEVGEPDLIPQKMIVGTSSGAFVSYVTGGKCNGMGTLFFWLESMQPWVPVNN